MDADSSIMNTINALKSTDAINTDIKTLRILIMNEMRIYLKECYLLNYEGTDSGKGI
jgi:hypothetical protein